MFTTLSLMFLTLIAIGTFLTLILYNFDWRSIRTSRLDRKILMWLPIAIIFLVILYLGKFITLVVLIIIGALSLLEFYRFHKQGKANAFLRIYVIFFVVALAHLGFVLFIYPDVSLILSLIVLSTVISDVCGFFFGNFLGYHKLPEVINGNKSWEGVLGQVVGAMIGVLLIKYFIGYSGSIWIFLPIGLGSAFGDLMNSRAKRILGIKSWSNFISGHGGFADRFCSLAGSGFLTFYYILIFLK